MSIYEILPALDLTQSVHAKISIGMHRVVKFKMSYGWLTIFFSFQCGMTICEAKVQVVLVFPSVNLR
jgi:hypothetical protein